MITISVFLLAIAIGFLAFILPEFGLYICILGFYLGFQLVSFQKRREQRRYAKLVQEYKDRVEQTFIQSRSN